MTTKAKTDGKTKELCHYDSLTRTRFFRGMLLTEEHLSAEQTYHREALKRLNRHLYGPGIVCGLEVDHTTGTTGLCIKVQPGLALDCHGNAIDVCKPITLDLADVCRKAFPEGCDPGAVATITRYLVLRYVEIPADPEPVLTPSDDCTPADPNAKCQPSKYREGFCLEIREQCPDSDPCGEEGLEGTPGVLAAVLIRSRRAEVDVIDHQPPEDEAECMKSPPCQDCACDDGAVGLATLVIDCAQNKLKIRCDCRQYVWSPRFLRWLVCEMFRGADKDGGIGDTTGLTGKLPSVSALVHNPLHAMREVGEAAVDSRARKRKETQAQAQQQAYEGQQAPGGSSRRPRARTQEQQRSE